MLDSKKLHDFKLGCEDLERGVLIMCRLWTRVTGRIVIKKEGKGEDTEVENG